MKLAWIWLSLAHPTETIMRIRTWPAIAFGVCSLWAAGPAYADPATLAPESLQAAAPLTLVTDTAGTAGTLVLAGDYDNLGAVSPSRAVDTVLTPISSGVNAGLDTLDHALNSGATQLNSALSTARSLPDMPSMPNLPNVTSVLDPVTSAIGAGVQSLPSLTGAVSSVSSGALLAPLTKALNSGITGISQATSGTPLTNLLGGLLSAPSK
jgi:hypothetical protein